MATAPRLYLDEDVPFQLAARLKASGFDVQTARDAGQLGNSDDAQLEFASEAGRVLVTHNVRDYAALADLWARTGRHHAGLILGTTHSPASLSAAIYRLLELYPGAEDWTDITVSTVL